VAGLACPGFTMALRLHRAAMYQLSPKEKPSFLGMQRRRWQVRSTTRILFMVPLMIVGLTACASAQNARQDWKQFRTVYPYHLQVVAVSQPDAGGYRTLIVSEPPPRLTIEDFRQISPRSLQDLSVAQHPIGVNGWVRDLVVRLPPMPEEQLTELIDNVHRKLFKTSYKAYAIAIPGSSTSNPRFDLDLHVTSAELNKWLLGDKPDIPSEPWTAIRVALFALLLVVFAWRARANAKRKRIFRILVLTAMAAFGAYLIIPSRGTTSNAAHLKPITGGEPVVLRTVLDQQKSGVFLSTESGFVVWSFPRNTSLDNYRVEARQFSVDADLLMGAVASGKQIAIIGRERVTPIAVLPPLRTETILQLAAANEKELAQSYERKYIFAGRFTKTDDWAPIFLSDELIDTEYGSLLNITDQMLKSWSQHGEVKYANFNYAEPPHYPFPSPISIHYKVRELTFNWNTKGAGYATQNGPYEVFALNRLAALPVDYLARSNQDLRNAEDIAYRYYTGLSDPNLVRVVEYAAIYQIFRHFQITATAPVMHHASVVTSLRPAVAGVMNEIASITDDQLDRATARSHDEEGAKSIQQLREVRDALVEFQSKADEGQKQTLIAAIADPVVFRSLLTKSDSDRSTRMIVELAGAVADMKHFLDGYDSPDNSRAAAVYVRESDRKDDTWIHTPTIVISRAQGDVRGSVGGHNLSSVITELRPDTELAAGSVRVAQEDGAKVVYYNPADSGKVPEIVRSAGRYEEKNAGELQDVLTQEIRNAKAPERPLGEMLGFSDTFKPAELRGLQPVHLGLGGEAAGWAPSGNWIPLEDGKVLAALEPRTGPVNKLGSVVITRNGDGGYLVVHGSNQAIRAADAPSAIDAALTCVKNDESPTVHLHFRGFEPRQAKGFVRTAELDMDPQTAKRISASIEESLSPEDLARIAKEDFDFSRAEVKAVSDVKVTEEGRAVDVELDVPAKAAGHPSLWMRIRIILEGGIEFTQEMLGSIVQMIQDIVGDSNAILSAKQVVKELRTIHPGIKGVEMRLGRESKDVLLVFRHSPIPHSAEASHSA
jgi:hypothetical protein